jgi:hypothetical protein
MNSLLAGDNPQWLRVNALNQLTKSRHQFAVGEYDEVLNSIEHINYSVSSFSLKIDSLKEAIREFTQIMILSRTIRAN